MERLTVAVIGMGERGRIHLYGFLKNLEYFHVAGVCDRKEENLEKAVKEYGISKDICYTDARLMLDKVRPDILAFVTMPHIRLPLAELAAEYKVRGLMFEKPMATSLDEADKIRKLCMENGIKTIVCHQHKYVRSFMRLKEAIDSGELGEIHEMKASCQPQASQLGTHYIDYLLWANGGKRVLSVTGHVHGNFYLDDSHPSPDYVMGQMICENGVRMTLECGYFASRHEEHNTEFTHGPAEAAYWTDDRLTVYGTKGYAWASCNGKYAVFSPLTSPDIREGDYHDFFQKEQYDAQVRYTKDFADWMNKVKDGHPCSLSQAYHGYEILEAMYVSAIERTRVDLPMRLPLQYDALEVLKDKLGPVKYRRF
ncbi:Gfo/Idh/MocA family protein [Murimonas intestini]|uniref:Gfo/Idh/MocA family protein n=1 Tax=Murimonas intestini TaxID=1337051 RepID=UPI0011DDBF60|nr:Gfo/Idh/MocA family oxidoreductase [Murimonas intestini]